MSFQSCNKLKVFIDCLKVIIGYNNSSVCATIVQTKPLQNVNYLHLHTLGQ